MLPMEHSAVLMTRIKPPHGFMTFVLSIFEWLLKKGFTVLDRLFTLYEHLNPSPADLDLHCFQKSIYIMCTLTQGDMGS